MYGDSLIFIGNPSLFFDSVADMHSLFFPNCICSHCRNNCIRAIAERTKFSTYLSFFDDDRFIYPISGHWVWQGEGWLTNLDLSTLLDQQLYTL
jgi:Amt family ammonium transporter